MIGDERGVPSPMAWRPERSPRVREIGRSRQMHTPAARGALGVTDDEHLQQLSDLISKTVLHAFLDFLDFSRKFIWKSQSQLTHSAPR